MESNTKERREKPRIGITLGDFNGVGPEVVMKALKDSRMHKICTPVIYGASKVISKYKRNLNIDFMYNQLGFHNKYTLSPQKINLVNCWSDNVSVTPGKVTEEAGKAAFVMLREATEALRTGFIDAVVTAPINKANIQQSNFNFPGHTEFFASKFGVKENLMLLTADSLKVGVVTGHIPLAEVPKEITRAKLTAKLEVLIHSLKHDFGISRPRVAVLGLNPHAGEEGLLGKEEQEIINPVVIELKKKGNLVFGSFPADGFFGMYQQQKFDGVLAMYHDQGLIPFKTLAFEKGVNYTAGLPIVRTSPDHGTAYSIAGKGIADETSLREAIFLACDIVKYRQEQTELKRTPPIKKIELKEESSNDS